MLEKDLVTAKQAAVILGRSPSTISRALAQGRLAYADPERKLLMRQGLAQRFSNSTRRKADAPKVAVEPERVALISNPPSPPELKTTYWERLDQKLQMVLEGSAAYWSEPPDPQRLKLFCRTIDELRSQVEAEGLVEC